MSVGGCGHWPQVEHADEVRRGIASFLLAASVVCPRRSWMETGTSPATGGDDICQAGRGELRNGRADDVEAGSDHCSVDVPGVDAFRNNGCFEVAECEVEGHIARFPPGCGRVALHQRVGDGRRGLVEAAEPPSTGSNASSE